MCFVRSISDWIEEGTFGLMSTDSGDSSIDWSQDLIGDALVELVSEVSVDLSDEVSVDFSGELWVEVDLSGEVSVEVDSSGDCLPNEANKP